MSGLSNEEFASKLWSIAYPFTKADAGTSLEIFHDNHEALETRAPMYAFVPYTINGQPHIVGAYTCTPLVKFPVSALTPSRGQQVPRHDDRASSAPATGRSTWWSTRRTARTTC